MTTHHRAPLRALLALATAGALGLALPATASAHVTVSADDAAPGAWISSPSAYPTSPTRRVRSDSP